MRLCYIIGDYGRWAYFCPDGARGDDWHKYYWVDNSGPPHDEYACVKVAWDGDLQTPSNGDVTVAEINAGKCPWLKHEERRVFIYAGVTLPEFIRMVQQAGGNVYTKVENVLT